MILAGTLAPIVLASTLFLTTAPAAIIEFSPIVTLGSIVAAAPIHTLCFICIEFKSSVFRLEGSTG